MCRFFAQGRRKRLGNLLPEMILGNRYFYLKVQKLIFDLKTKNKKRYSKIKGMSVAGFDLFFFLISSPWQDFAESHRPKMPS